MSTKEINPVRVQIREPEKRSSGNYYPLPLPDEVELLGIEQGDMVFLSMVEDVVGGSEICFIEGSIEEETRYDMTVQSQDGCSPELYVQCPSAFSGEYGSPPFNQLDKGDWIVVEVLEGEEKLRIYSYQDFKYRQKEITEQQDLPPEVDVRTIVPIIPASSDSAYTDLTYLYEDVPSQRFEFIPFDGEHEWFIEAAEENPVYKRMLPGSDAKQEYTFYGCPSIFNLVRDVHSVPSQRARKIEVLWTPQIESRNAGHLKIYEEYNVDSVKIELPEHGTYRIVAYIGGSEGCYWLTASPRLSPNNDPIRGSWSTYLYSDGKDEQVPKVFIPAPRYKKGAGYWDQY